jgi:hypothetical protein
MAITDRGTVVELLQKLWDEGIDATVSIVGIPEGESQAEVVIEPNQSLSRIATILGVSRLDMAYDGDKIRVFDQGVQLPEQTFTPSAEEET